MQANNSLTGTIPDGLSAFGRMVSLDLSYNMLSGTIPPSLGMLGNLTTPSSTTGVWLNNNLVGVGPPRPAAVVPLPSCGAPCRVKKTKSRRLPQLSSDEGLHDPEQCRASPPPRARVCARS